MCFQDLPLTHGQFRTARGAQGWGRVGWGETGDGHHGVGQGKGGVAQVLPAYIYYTRLFIFLNHLLIKLNT